MTIGTSLSEAADHRNNVVGRSPRFELGGRFYLSYYEYKGDQVVDIRKYFMIEGEENPTRNGMCLRLPNFIKVLEGFKCLYDIYTVVKSKSEEIVQAVSEVLVLLENPL